MLLLLLLMLLLLLQKSAHLLVLWPMLRQARLQSVHNQQHRHGNGQYTVLLLIITGKEKEKSLSGDRLKNPNNNSAASGDI
jgi:hypothetical protein